MFRLKAILIFTLVLLWMGCSDLGDPENLDPAISWTADSVAFGTVTVTSTQIHSLQIINSGAGVLLGDLTLTDPGSAFSLSTLRGIELESDDTLTLYIDFTPQAAIAYVASIQLDSNDPFNPAISIPVTGTGTDLPVPGITFSSQELEFGVVHIGSDSTQTLTMNSVGTDTLIIEGIILTGAAFAVQKPDQPNFLPPDSSLAIDIQFTPTVEGTSSGFIEVVSNVADSPHLIDLEGSGQTTVSFAGEVMPIFVNNGCTGCHGSNGGLNLSTYADLMAGTSNHGPVVVSGEGANSYLIRKLKGMEGQIMPPAGGLSGATIQTIENWIDQGALDN